MVVKIRLSRFGKKRQPFYNIVVSQARTARDSKPMEVLGTYDPTPRVPIATDAPEVIDEVTGLPRKPKRYKDIQLDQSRTKYWLGVGAQPSEPVERILCLNGSDRTNGAETGRDEESNTCTLTVRSQHGQGAYEVVTLNLLFVALRRRLELVCSLTVFYHPLLGIDAENAGKFHFVWNIDLVK
ncbi:hypothetical protein EPUS_07567 [Endocarpon pusillum Z07020]|uniref:Ribosomal protein S16 n=1 Tax=Endocarpon pusillum (strain Z07020 / HMAS-L-300199) TaxID=1263415 RepID=U1GDG1_ENDPU|nr:uncharacterized protein EPUS_07567 [Endocarpon pusillum Z07020]ERF69741.1 hypothetical protein EPUS_07567 [Endocarpon pusillum Z07020]